ncbi:nucleotidyltransferase [Candidatus Sumerlaeota bacterium]|nr:nucleotidyltransferase [Candidatus Sumerlaeota bacterium]
MKPSLVIMAAGIGSRYGGLKQIDPVGPGGQIIIEYSIYDAVRAGFEKVVFIIRKEIEEAFREHIGDKMRSKIDVQYAYQERDSYIDGYAYPAERTKPWGTGQAILVTESVVQEPFMVINADDYYGVESYQKLYDWLSSRAEMNAGEYCMAGYTLRNTLSDHGTVTRAVCEVEDGKLSKAIERLKIEKVGQAAVDHAPDGDVPLSGDEPVSMNMWGFLPSLYDQLRSGFKAFLQERGQEMKSEYLIPTIVDQLIKQGKATCDVLPTSATWFGITYPEDKAKVVAAMKEMHDKGLYPDDLWK